MNINILFIKAAVSITVYRKFIATYGLFVDFEKRRWYICGQMGGDSLKVGIKIDPAVEEMKS